MHKSPNAPIFSMPSLIWCTWLNSCSKNWPPLFLACPVWYVIEFLQNTEMRSFAEFEDQFNLCLSSPEPSSFFIRHRTSFLQGSGSPWLCKSQNQFSERFWFSPTVQLFATVSLSLLRSCSDLFVLQSSVCGPRAENSAHLTFSWSCHDRSKHALSQWNNFRWEYWDETLCEAVSKVFFSAGLLLVHLTGFFRLWLQHCRRLSLFQKTSTRILDWKL